jgi:Na+/H+ antiporter NhaD/arsenite permease-like protein
VPAIDRGAADGLILAVFAATYLGMAVGRVPGLRTDRPAIAVIAAVVIIFAKGIDLPQAARWVDLPTLALLFGLMVLSAQFAASGFYDACAERITRARGGPGRLLAVTILAGGLLSAVLANDIVAFAVTPLLCAGLAARRLNPLPFLIALAAACNVGSAATMIGNPQNILIAQKGRLDFVYFLWACGVPALLGLAVVQAVVMALWRGRWELPETGAPARSPTAAGPRIDRPVLIKALIAAVALLAAFTSALPRDVAALAIAAALLVSRRITSRRLLGSVDWSLLILFGGLFVVTGAVAELPATRQVFLDLAGGDWLPDRLSVMVPLMLAASNSIGNVPAVILLLQLWPGAPPAALYGLALLSTLAGNLLLTGSLANLIVAERAASQGWSLPFLAHAKAGVPITLLTTALAALWLWGVGLLPW